MTNDTPFLEAVCGTCHETFVPADEHDLIHIVRNDGVTECGGEGGFYETSDIAKAECLACGYTTDDPMSLELWNGYGDCPKCLTTGNCRWTGRDGSVVVVPEDDEVTS